jgi:hypothetical protein
MDRKLLLTDDPRMRRHWADGSAQPGLTLSALLAVWGLLRLRLPKALGVQLFDETSSLQAGWDILHRGLLPGWEGSPLYATWYAGWLAVARDPVAAYWAQWLATDLALFLITFALLRGWDASWSTAAIAACAWEFLAVTAIGWPRSYFFALLVVLVGVLLIQRTGRDLSLLVLGAATLVRPDYAAALLAFAARWCVRNLSRRVVMISGILVAAGAAVTMVASDRWGGGRLWVAFSQHASLRFVAGNPDFQGDPWADHARITSQLFPGAHTLGQAVHTSPGQVVRILLANVEDEVMGLVFWPSRWVVGDLPPLVLPLLVLPLLWKRVRYRLGSLPGLGLLACAMVSVLPSLLIMAKPTYSLTLLWSGVTLGPLGLEVLLRPAVARSPVMVQQVLGPLAIVALLGFAWAGQPPEAPVAQVDAVVSELRRSFASRPPLVTWRMLEADGGWCTYLDPGACERIDTGAKGPTESLESFLGRNRVNAIVDTRRLRSQAAFAGDPAFDSLLAHPERAGFSVAFDNGLARLLLKQ